MQAEATKELVQKLSKSKIYQDYERAFTEATGLPLTLRQTDVFNAALHGKKGENPFCALMADQSRTCAACLEAQQKAGEACAGESGTSMCFAGLCDTVVPVRIGKDLVGYLQTGQISLKKPTRARFSKVARQLVEWGAKVDLKQLEEAYFQSRVLSQKQYQSMIHLLEVFAQHLSTLANQIVVSHENADPPMIKRAKEYIQQNKADDLSLGQVAKAVNASTFYFCKMFKKATGIHFTEYLSRVRIEKSKNLLLNPNLRISEIAFQVGFQSLTHFNRVFRKMVGQSPTDYRKSLPGAVS